LTDFEKICDRQEKVINKLWKIMEQQADIIIMQERRLEHGQE